MSTNRSGIHIPAGSRLTVVADGLSSGTAYRMVDGIPSGVVQVPASSTRILGPFGEGRDYIVDSSTGLLTSSLADVVEIPDGGSLTGMVGNLSVIPDGSDMLLADNGQSLVFTSLTVNGTYTVNGELRVQAWPT